MKNRLALSLLFCLLLVPAFVHGQSGGIISPGDITGSITLIATPTYPKPNEAVSVRIQASGIDLDTSTITWRVNGQQMLSGRGEKVLNFTIGALGARTNVAVTIQTSSEVYNQSITLTPADIDLLWQGNTYVPPFYKGRALWSQQSSITILAIPQVSNVASSANLIYRWSHNGAVLGNSSGTGKNTFTFTDSILSKPQNIKVDVLLNNNTVLATRSITLIPIGTTLLVYENSPLYGYLLHREVGSVHSMQEKEATLAAFPLFFSTLSRNSTEVKYEWETNTGDLEARSSVTYRIPANSEKGSWPVNLSASHTDKVMQSASRNFLVQFGQ